MLLHVPIRHPLILSPNQTPMVSSPMCQPQVMNHRPAQNGSVWYIFAVDCGLLHFGGGSGGSPLDPPPPPQRPGYTQSAPAVQCCGGDPSFIAPQCPAPPLIHRSSSAQGQTSKPAPKAGAAARGPLDPTNSDVRRGTAPHRAPPPAGLKPGDKTLRAPGTPTRAHGRSSGSGAASPSYRARHAPPAVPATPPKAHPPAPLMVLVKPSAAPDAAHATSGFIPSVQLDPFARPAPNRPHPTSPSAASAARPRASPTSPWQSGAPRVWPVPVPQAAAPPPRKAAHAQATSAAPAAAPAPRTSPYRARPSVPNPAAKPTATAAAPLPNQKPEPYQAYPPPAHPPFPNHRLSLSAAANPSADPGPHPNLKQTPGESPGPKPKPKAFAGPKATPKPGPKPGPDVLHGKPAAPAPAARSSAASADPRRSHDPPAAAARRGLDPIFMDLLPTYLRRSSSVPRQRASFRTGRAPGSSPSAVKARGLHPTSPTASAKGARRHKYAPPVGGCGLPDSGGCGLTAAVIR